MSEVGIQEVEVVDGSALLMSPPRRSGAALLYLHWFDEAPNANRTQFLDEARAMAREGVVSLLPQLSFPWDTPPTDTTSDMGRIEAERASLSDAYAILSATDGVDAERIALVGHDFGAMHGMNLLGDVQLSGAVFIAPTPRWSDWFLPFWEIRSDRYDYMRALAPVDPITTVARADCPLLFQFGERDHYIATMTAQELFRAAPDPKRLIAYDCGHEMALAEIRDDRHDFLREALGF